MLLLLCYILFLCTLSTCVRRMPFSLVMLSVHRIDKPFWICRRKSRESEERLSSFFFKDLKMFIYLFECIFDKLFFCVTWPQ